MRSVALSFICISMLLSSALHAAKLDSLFERLKKLPDDTNKANTLNAIAWQYYQTADLDSSIKYAQRSVDLAKQLNFKYGIAFGYNTIGSSYTAKGNYTQGLQAHYSALRLREELNNEKGIAMSLMNIGIIYDSQGQFEKALDNYFRSLKLCEKMKNKHGIAITSGNIGNAYRGMGDFEKALTYYERALKLEEELGNKNNIVAWMGNLGVAYAEDAVTKKDPLEQRPLFDFALFYYFKAMKLALEINDKNMYSINLGNIGGVYLEMKRYVDAEKYLLKALAITDSIGDMDGVKEWESDLSRLFSEKGNYENALVHYKRYIVARDSVTNDEHTKQQTQLEMTYVFDKKQAADSIKNVETAKQEQLKHDQEIKQQKLYTYGGIIGLILMIIVAGVSFRAYRQKQNANEIITHQKELVEEKQKEILDSIHYAKRIQKSLLPTEKYIDKNFKRLRCS